MKEDEPTVKEHKGRQKGTPNRRTVMQGQAVDANSLEPPPFHRKSTPWTEEQAVAEMEFLVRFFESDDPDKLFIGQCLKVRGYKMASFYQELAKKFPASCGELLNYARIVSADKLAINALKKNFDSRFAVLAMQNMSKWKQNHQVDSTSTVQIKARDYKQIQPIINERMHKGPTLGEKRAAKAEAEKG